MKKEIIKINYTAEISLKRLNDVLTGAFEGGSNYWIEQCVASKGKILDCITSQNEYVMIKENDRDENNYRVAKNDVILAAQLMALQYPWYFEDILNENDDATTSDVLLQLATFKTIIYG